MGAFEGIRAYPTDSGPGIFRLTDHMKRLAKTAQIIQIELGYTVEELVEATKAVVRESGLDTCYIRPIAYLGYGEMGLNPLPCPVDVVVACWPWGTYLGDEGVANGIKAKVSSWKRHDPNVIPPAAKVTGGYINSSMAKVEALKGGYDEAILLNSQGYVSEGTGENIFAVKNGVVITPPTSAGALEGITRDSTMTILRDRGYKVVEDNLLRSDLYTVEELFVTGTAAEIVPVRSVDDRDLGEPGPITRLVQSVYADTVRGKVPEYGAWVELVKG
jgi:branched-chain amino acid aminotransferase